MFLCPRDFFRQEYWSGLSCHALLQGMALQAEFFFFFTSEPRGKPRILGMAVPNLFRLGLRVLVSIPAPHAVGEPPWGVTQNENS